MQGRSRVHLEPAGRSPQPRRRRRAWYRPGMVATVVLVTCIVLLLGGGAWFYPRQGLQVAGIVIAGVLVLWLTGHLR